MRRMIVLIAAVLLAATGPANAQDSWPVSLGLGGGLGGGMLSDYHGLLVVGITPPRSPIGLRLDGLLRPRTDDRFANVDLLTGVSASAVITLRRGVWRPTWSSAPRGQASST